MTTPNPPVETRILPYGSAAIAAAATEIARGGVVAVPTETVYGLAADATAAAAVARIYAAKGRPSFNPLIVHVLGLAAAEKIAIVDDEARALAEAFWPGPLTLVLPLREGSGIAPLVTAGLATIALRVPAHRAIRALLEATGKPLAAPSANASGGISPTRSSHVVASLGGRIPLVVDDGATAAGLESTIVQAREVLRPGPITLDDLARILPLFSFPGEGRGAIARGLLEGAVQGDDRLATGPRPSPGKANGKITSPGQLASHYAPVKPLRLNVTEAASGDYMIGFGSVVGSETLSPTADLTEAAANLFDALHRADASSSASIAVAPIPQTGIGVAINDRLRRAAHR